MKTLLTATLLLGSVVAVSACSATGTSELDETRTQAPYADERTVGYEPYQAPAPVKSAEPVFEQRTYK